MGHRLCSGCPALLPSCLRPGHRCSRPGSSLHPHHRGRHPGAHSKCSAHASDICRGSPSDSCSSNLALHHEQGGARGEAETGPTGGVVPSVPLVAVIRDRAPAVCQRVAKEPSVPGAEPRTDEGTDRDGFAQSSWNRLESRRAWEGLLLQGQGERRGQENWRGAPSRTRRCPAGFSLACGHSGTSRQRLRRWVRARGQCAHGARSLAHAAPSAGGAHTCGRAPALPRAPAPVLTRALRGLDVAESCPDRREGRGARELPGLQICQALRTDRQRGLPALIFYF